MLAERAVQRDQIHFMRKVNNEAKARRSTRLLVLGKAKVMSYEDLEEARAKRAAKDAAKAKGKGTPGRKRKSPALGQDAPKPKAKVARVSIPPEPARDSMTWNERRTGCSCSTDDMRLPLRHWRD
jgi:hypothetical protein